jgi:divalent metal cation (Fe/Co/Zn/Cd) transporter
MEIGTLRDVVIIVSGLVVSLASIFVTVVVYLVYYRVRRILKSTSTIAAKAEVLATTAIDKIGQPLVTVAGIIQGIACGIRGINSIFKKGE